LWERETHLKVGISVEIVEDLDLISGELGSNDLETSVSMFEGTEDIAS
jgi:hypothetical protein